MGRYSSDDCSNGAPHARSAHDRNYFENRYTLDDKLNILHNHTLSVINSLSVTRTREGQTIQDAEETYLLRSERIRQLNNSPSMPEGYKVRLDKKTGLAALYKGNRKYNPKSTK